MAKRERIRKRHTCEWCDTVTRPKTTQVRVYYLSGDTAKMRLCLTCIRRAEADEYSRIAE